MENEPTKLLRTSAFLGVNFELASTLREWEEMEKNLKY